MLRHSKPTSLALTLLRRWGYTFRNFCRGSLLATGSSLIDRPRCTNGRGKTASEKWRNDKSSYLGSTNFQSVIDLFCNLKAQGTPESDFPSGIVCISDGEFNPAQLGKTNVEMAINKLRQVGFSPEYCDSFKICLWNLDNGHYGAPSNTKFETFGSVKNVFYLSGYSASNVQFLLNDEVETAQDLFDAAMDQELLRLVKI